MSGQASTSDARKRQAEAREHGGHLDTFVDPYDKADVSAPALERVRRYLHELDGFYGDDETPDDVLDYADGGSLSAPLLLSDVRSLAALADGNQS